MLRSSYSRVLDRVFRQAADENEELQAQRTGASELVSELLRLTSEQRELLINNSHRYRVWPLADALLAQCRSGWADDAERSEELALISLEVIDRIESDSDLRERLLNDLRAEAWSYIGNCRRIRSDLRSSERAFLRAESFLARGTGDVLEEARLQDLRASLLGARGEFDGAIELLGRAIAKYRQANDRHLEGRALIKQAKIFRDGGRVADSIEVTKRAAALIDPDADPTLVFILKKNLVTYYLETSRADEAKALLPEVRELGRLYGSRLERLRLLWVEGKVRKLLGQKEFAEQALVQVRDGFIAAGIGYDVALISLDLAALYLESGRTTEVRQLAAETMPVFASRDVHRELLVAWSLFCRAAEVDAATLQLVDEVARTIRGSEQRNSALPEAY